MENDDDYQIGRNLKRLRGDVSREMLAAKMVERGFRWSRATVFNIEDGKRSLKLKEASAVLECLDLNPTSDLSKLLDTQDEVDLAIDADRVRGLYKSLFTEYEVLRDHRRALAADADSLANRDMLDKQRSESAIKLLQQTQLKRIVELFIAINDDGPVVINGKDSSEYYKWLKAWDDDGNFSISPRDIPPIADVKAIVYENTSGDSLL